MNHSDKERFLSEILSAEDLEDFRQKSLERGLISLRRCREQRRIVRGCMLATLPLLLALGLVWRQRPGLYPQERRATSRAESTVKFITDEELFALFPGRPLALIGTPGQQELVFLDALNVSDDPWP